MKKSDSSFLALLSDFFFIIQWNEKGLGAKVITKKKHDLKIMLHLVIIMVWFLFYWISWKVFPCLMSPVLNPFLNQYILCSEVPWVKESGTI